MQRYFADEKDNRFYFTEEDRHHILRVMRMRIGDEIICVNKSGKSAVCSIAEITDEQVVADVVQWNEGDPELPIRITIGSGLPKGDKLELIIQKGTELGAFQFIPFTAARSVVKWDEKKSLKKVDRWNKIAKEAAEQSHRSKVPEVLSPMSLKELIQYSKDYDYVLIAFEEEARTGESKILSQTLKQMQRDQSLLIVFGPEGGFSNEEVAQLKNEGFQACGLGPRILRTETAPLYVLSAVSYHFELLR